MSSVLVVDPGSNFGIGAVPPNVAGSAPRSRHGAFRVDDELVIIGGTTTSGAQTIANGDIDHLDLETYRIQTASSLPEPRLDSAFGQLGSVVIVAGGFENDVASAHLELVSQGFSQHSLLAPRWGAQIVEQGGRALIVGGFDANNEALATTEWLALDGSGFSMTAGPLVAPRGAGCAVALTLGRTFLLGGALSPEVLNADGTIEPLVFTGAAQSGQSCVRLEDGSVLIAGGADSFGRPLAELWRFVPAD